PLTGGAAPPPLAQSRPVGPVGGAEEVAPWYITFPPRGAGLPKGSGTARQGLKVYEEKCQYCHGVKGAGKPADALAGGIGSLATAEPGGTVRRYWADAPTLFAYTPRPQPTTKPPSL